MLTLYFATPDFACQYSGCLLSLADQMRLQQNPHLANQIQWQVSRAVKAVVPCEWGVLSHSANHVAWLVSDESSGSLKMGVDLQHMKLRCFSAWHDLILSASECAWLREQHFAPVAYFALWALKESLIKANDLDWADLRDVGLQRRGDAWRLVVNDDVWFGKVWLLANDFVVAVVHQQPNEIALHALNNWQSRGVIFYFQAA